jgi:hypothetical protein
VGSAASGHYIAEKGFEEAENHLRWLDRYGARIIHPPKRNSRERSWPKRLRRWVASIRQIVESVYDKLLNAFGLHRERPHEMSGAESSGGEGDAAQLLHLAQRATWPSLVGFR